MTLAEWTEARAQTLRVAWRENLDNGPKQAHALQKVAEEGPAHFAANVGGTLSRKEMDPVWTRFHEIQEDPLPTPTPEVLP